MKCDLIVCRNLSVPLSSESGEAHDAAAVEKATKKYRSAFGKTPDGCGFIYKKSVDARKRDAMKFIYSVAFDAATIRTDRLPEGFEAVSLAEPDFTPDEAVKHKRVIVVGMGPCGLFAALALANAGLCPTVLERGQDIGSRVKTVDTYWHNGTLDEESNVQFGEGGAGMFSDGKLLTRISDPLSSYVLHTFAKFGAPEEIVYLAKPHIGTDRLRGIVERMRAEIIRLGGSIRFGAKVTDVLKSSDGRVCGVCVNGEETIACDALFLCIGHSARDTFVSLHGSGITLAPKDFSVGVRVEHLQKDIDEALYGRFAGFDALGHASYTLAAKEGGRACYSFCMCPGGTVVASASAKGEIVTNGMSIYARDGANANAAIAVSVGANEAGSGLFAGMEFQRALEQTAFEMAHGAAPVMLLGDLLAGEGRHEPKRVMPTYTGRTELCNLTELFPDFIIQSMRSGFARFDKQIRGFCVHDAVLTAPETRTSSPIRIPRNALFVSDSCPNLYPLGEGAGYAGGITSAAVDGLRGALAFLHPERKDV